jgi:parallel beta-helix repeat protein
MHDHHDEPRTERTPAADHATQRRAMLAGLGGLAAGAMLTRSARAGDLDPPAGPVGPTMKRLDEIEPRTPVGPDTTPGASNAVFVISQPGSYYLTGNIAGEAGKHGVLINSADVTLDLNGFALIGVADSLSAVQVSGNRAAIRNGSISGWGASGVNSGSAGMLLQHLRSWENASRGITIGNNAIVAHCSVFGNGDIGIRVGGGSAVRDCVARQNGSHGVAVLAGSTVTGCTALENQGDGLSLADGVTASDCAATNNTGRGVASGVGCVISHCSARGNVAGGVYATFDSAVHACVSRGNAGFGVECTEHCAVTACTAEGNALANILVESRCVVRDCLASQAETVAGNEGVGIVASGSGNRLEGNTCADNPVGLRAVNAGNLIVRNTLSQNNTQVDIAAGNALGPVVGGSVNGTAVTGNSNYFGDIGTLDPSANAMI